MTRRKRGENLMATGSNPANIWSLTEDRRNVRLAIPPVNLAGLAEPLKLLLDFDAGAICWVSITLVGSEGSGP